MQHHSTACKLCVLAMLLLYARVSQGATWYRPSGCQSECDEQHRCVSTKCTHAWEKCPDGLAQVGSVVMQPDYSPDQCKENPCAIGDCAEGYVTKESRACTFLGKLGWKQETCCPLRPQVQCCQRLNCTLELADCHVPQQQSLDDPSKSNIQYTNIADAGSVQFPFYSAKSVPAGGSCDAVRVWGKCTCKDGTAVPGCKITDSSTWLALKTNSNGTLNTAVSEQHLPANLSLTCFVDKPVQPAADAAASSKAGDAGTEAAQAATGTGSIPQPENHFPAASGEDHHRRLSGGMIVLIVLSSVLGSLLLGVVALAVLLLRKPAPDTWVEGRLSSMYEPVFTGASYNPVPKTRGSARRQLPSVRELWGAVKRVLGRDGSMYSEVNMGQAAYRSHRAKMEARLAAQFPLSTPAQPPDAFDDDEDQALYTLEDLEDGGPGDAPGAQFRKQYRQFSTGGGPTSAQGTELELGHMREQAWTGGSMGTRTPHAVSPHMVSVVHTGSSVGAHHNPSAGVIHTTPVYLGSPPVSPQPTGTSKHGKD